jgi:hypothetical protein
MSALGLLSQRRDDESRMAQQLARGDEVIE